MQLASLNVQVDSELRRDVDILATIRDISVKAYVEEALRALVARDRADNEVGYQTLLEIRQRLDKEVDRLRKSA